MSVSQTKKHLLLVIASIISLTLLNFNTHAAVTDITDSTLVNRGLECTVENQCDLILYSKNNYAYAITLESCYEETSGLGICNFPESPLRTGTINVRCGTLETIVLSKIGDNVLCNINEDVQIYSDVKSNTFLVSVHLFPKGSNDPISWSIAITGGFIGSICLATTVAVIAFIIHECRRRAGGDNQPGFFPMLPRTNN